MPKPPNQSSNEKPPPCSQPQPSYTPAQCPPAGTGALTDATAHNHAYGNYYGSTYYPYRYGQSYDYYSWSARWRQWEEKTEPIEVCLSSQAHWQFRTAVETMHELGWKHHEFYALLVVHREAPLNVQRLEFPRQWISGASCGALAADIRRVREALGQDEAIAGSIHFHPFSARSDSGFLSWTDYDLLHKMSLEQAAQLLTPMECPLRSFVLPEGTELLADGHVILSPKHPKRITIEPAVRDLAWAAHTVCLVNAGPGYYGKVLRTTVCLVCGARQRFLHPAEVVVDRSEEEQPTPQAESELIERLRQCLQTTPAWPKKPKRQPVPAQKDLRRRKLAARAAALADELTTVLEELKSLEDAS